MFSLHYPIVGRKDDFFPRNPGKTRPLAPSMAPSATLSFFQKSNVRLDPRDVEEETFDRCARYSIGAVDDY